MVAETDDFKPSGFTLLEVLVAVSISALLFWMLLAATNQFSRTARHASGGASAFDQARLALGEMRDSLERATLGPYWAVTYDAAGEPTGYHRQADLHFTGGEALDWFPAGSPVSGAALFFQAPLGLETGEPHPGPVLNTRGYFVEWRNTRADAPAAAALPDRWRFQLRELREAGEQLGVMKAWSDPHRWIREAIGGRGTTHLVAENVAWVLFRYHSPSGAAVRYQWDSRLWDGNLPQPAESHQMPPTVEIVLLVLDEAVAARLGSQGSTLPTLPLEGLFTHANRLEEDLATFESRLAALWPQGNFRLMKGAVAIRAARWSLDPTAPDPTPLPEEGGEG